MRKVVRLSRILKWGVGLFCLSLPFFEAGYWITNGYSFLAPFWVEPLPSFGGRIVTWGNLNELQKLFGFLINMIPLAFSIFALGMLAKLFSSFERLEFFKRENVSILKKAGWALVFGQIVYPIYYGLLSLNLTFRNPVGERNVSISLGGHQFEVLAIGLSILVAAWIFEEAVKLKEEQEATV